MDVALTSISTPAGTRYVPCHASNPIGASVLEARSAAIRSPRSTERFTTSTSEAPASASSVTIARAAPPAPSTTTRLPFGSVPASVRRPRRKPLPSVFSPINRSPSRRTVFTAPMIAALGAVWSRYWITETLCGMVRLRPRIPNARTPSMASRRSQGFTSTVRYRQFNPSAWNAASCMAPVGFSATGCPKQPTSSALKFAGIRFRGPARATRHRGLRSRRERTASPFRRYRCGTPGPSSSDRSRAIAR